MHIYICNVVSIYVFAYPSTCLRICLYIHIYTYTRYIKTMYIFIIHCFKVRIRIR